MEEHLVCVVCGLIFDDGPPTRLPAEAECGAECVVVRAFVCAEDGAGAAAAQAPPAALTARFGRRQ